MAAPDSMEECIHGMETAWCVMCNGRAAHEAKAPADAPRVFHSKFEGQCPGCNLPIQVGQLIAWMPERPARHKDCWT